MRGNLWGSMFVCIAMLNLLVFIMTLVGYKPSEWAIKFNYLIIATSFVIIAANVIDKGEEK